jgi:hypothetical protein
MRARHDLLDASTFGGQLFLCACGHWQASGPWGLEVVQKAAAGFSEHVALWEAAEAELDEVDPTFSL